MMGEIFYCSNCKRDRPRTDRVRLNQYRIVCRSCANFILSRQRMTPAQRDYNN
jgi:hypothetical protein